MALVDDLINISQFSGQVAGKLVLGMNNLIIPTVVTTGTTLFTTISVTFVTALATALVPIVVAGIMAH